MISGNSAQGVWISAACTNEVEGDYIGLSSGGAQDANGGNGVQLDALATGNTIGGSVTGSGNVISGNTGDGVDISHSGTTGNWVESNYIGVATGGTSALANGQSGVAIDAGASNNTIGGAVSGDGNVISGNDSDGVYISDQGTTGNLVAGDRIGTGYGGEHAVPNYDGVVIQNGAANNTIGGTTAAMRNLISGNTEDGVHIVDSGTSGNMVEGNYIGLNVSGSSAVGNGASGVAIYAGASGNTIGGSVAGSGNVVSGNVGDGFYISGGGTNANVVDGDYIGTDYTGSVAVHNDDGVYVGGGTTNNTIGGTTAVTRDVISGNTTNGVEMFSVGTAGNVVEGDYIGISRQRFLGPGQRRKRRGDPWGCEQQHGRRHSVRLRQRHFGQRRQRLGQRRVYRRPEYCGQPARG